jgi:phosphoadenosine phosphosulfate reductase
MTDILKQKAAAAVALMRVAAREYGPAAFSSSLGAEDMVLTDLIYTHHLAVDIFTLDTGRLPPETYTLLEAIGARYGARPRIVFPRTEPVEDYVNQHGINGFYNSVELRKSCCFIRKVEPLKRALASKRAWVTGMRREQSVTRNELPLQAYDPAYRLEKFNPLADWSHDEVWTYVRERAVPYHALHDRGYPSIGCAPCTRPVAPGEDVRAGRWWWESPESKECGLHVSADGRLERAKEPA